MKKAFLATVLQGFLVGSGFAQTDPTAAEAEFGRNWISGISMSSPGEDILVAAMLAQQFQPSSAPELLEMELAEPELDKLRLSIAHYYCRNNTAANICIEHVFADELIASDPDNLEPYLYAMVSLLDAGNDAAALTVLARGNAATEANTYHFDRLNMVRARFRSADYPQDSINEAAEALAGALDTYLLYVKLLSICTEKSAASTEWKTQCLALGGKLVTLGNTVVQNIHGFAIQRDALGDTPADSASKAAIIEKMAAYNQIRDAAAARLGWVKNIALKPDLVYDEINEFGEIQAIERAIRRLE